jgi:hypothetical protein
MEPVAIALALAKFAPSLIKYFTGSDKAADVAGKVIDVAKAVTGASTGEAALAVVQADPAKQMEFQLAVGAQQLDWDRMYLADTQNARGRDVDIVQAGGHNYRANAMAAAACALVLICLGIVVWSTEIDEYAKGTITLVCGRALGWVEQIFSFEFGTTRANRAKDDTINKLSGG